MRSKRRKINTPFPQHIPFQHRKALCARLLILESFQPKRLDFHDPKSLHGFEQLRKAAFSIADNEIFKEDHAISMDNFLRSFAKRLRDQSKENLGDINGLSALLDSLDQKISNISCHNCSKLNSVICNGSDDDDQLVSMEGQCIGPLHKMFHLAEEVGFELYRKYSLLFQEIEQKIESKKAIKLSFSTTFVNKKPHDIPCNSYVSGDSEYERKDPLSTIVKLIVKIEKFDWDTYLAVPYVIFHEIIVHAFQGLYPLGCTRTYSEPDDDFAEGWMDWVSLKVMDEHLRDRYSAIDHIEKAEEFHRARINYETEDRSQYAIRRSYGKETARRLSEFMKFLPIDNPWELFLAISTDLNVLQQSTQQRMDFVKALHRRLPSGDDRCEKNPTKYTTIVRSIKKYEEKKDIRAFLQSILELK